LLVAVAQSGGPTFDVNEDDDRAQAERLVQQRIELRQSIRNIGDDLRGLDDFANVNDGYGQELNEHRARLASIGLVPESAADNAACPLCATPLAADGPDTVIEQRLGRVNRRLDLAQRERPKIEAARSHLAQQREAALAISAPPTPEPKTAEPAKPSNVRGRWTATGAA
jgi:hypothetical protein